jgi:hypothetical protein
MLQRIASFDRRSFPDKCPFFAVESNCETFLRQSSGPYNTIDLVNTSSGMIEACNVLAPCMDNFDEVVYSKRTALCYQSSGNIVSVVDLRLGYSIWTGSIPSKPNQRVVSACASSFKEGIFFITMTGEFVVHALSTTTESGSTYIFLTNYELYLDT